MTAPVRFAAGAPAIAHVDSAAAGPPLVLLHGVTRCRDDWQGMVPALSHDWRVIAVDHRGHGDSGRAEGYLVTDYVADMVRLLSGTIAEPVVLVGHSLGAMVAAAVAAAVPDLVRGAVLEDPPFHGMGTRIAGTAWQAQFAGMRAAALRGGSVDELAAALAAIELPTPGGGTTRLGALRDPAALAWSARCLARLDPEVLAPLVAGRWLDGYDPVGVASRIRCPVVLLHADPRAGGALADDEAAAFAAAAADCRVERFPGCGHLIHWHLPDRVVAAVESLGARNRC
ncbi:MAG: alpha/beta fold hydrolase [Planctomycetia bacterium]